MKPWHIILSDVLTVYLYYCSDHEARYTQDCKTEDE